MDSLFAHSKVIRYSSNVAATCVPGYWNKGVPTRTGFAHARHATKEPYFFDFSN